jgi:hypothetical protein
VKRSSRGKEHLLEVQAVLDSHSILMAFFSTGSYTRIVFSLATTALRRDIGNSRAEYLSASGRREERISSFKPAH